MTGLPPAEAPLLACPECDLLVRPVALPAHARLRCPRCDAELARHLPQARERALAWVCAALVCFTLANVYPLLRMEVQGIPSSTTVVGTVLALQADGMLAVAALVCFTAIVAPALMLGGLLCLLWPRLLGFRRSWINVIFRLVCALRHWGMVEVFMLGLLIALGKLTHLASVHIGVALWAMAALMFCTVAAFSAFDAYDPWDELERERARA